ncbi:MAG: phosphotransferase [Candidatus Promineifilaceae bacterium]
MFTTDTGQTINLASILQENYHLNITAITDAPRQFVAYTFFITADSQKFFCKIIDKPRFIPRVIQSLPPLDNLHQLGFSKIAYPIPTVSKGLYLKFGDILVVLFNYINAPQNYAYDNVVFGQTLAELHNLTEQLSATIPPETFQFGDESVFRHRLGKIVTSNPDTPASLALKELTVKNHDNLLFFYDTFLSLGEKCRDTKWQMVITHGDAPGNILVKSPQDIYLVDWDDLLLAPAERDLWFLLGRNELLDGYLSVRPNYEINQDAVNYYLFNRYFNDLVEYWDEIIGKSSEEHKMDNLKQMKWDLFEEDGWLYPLVKRSYHQG